MELWLLTHWIRHVGLRKLSSESINSAGLDLNPTWSSTRGTRSHPAVGVFASRRKIALMMPPPFAIKRLKARRQSMRHRDETAAP